MIESDERQRTFLQTLHWLAILTGKPYDSFDALDERAIAAEVRKYHRAHVISGQICVLYCVLAHLKGIYPKAFARHLMYWYDDQRSNWRNFDTPSGIAEWSLIADREYRPLIARGAYRPWVTRDVALTASRVIKAVESRSEEVWSWGNFFDSMANKNRTPRLIKSALNLIKMLFAARGSDRLPAYVTTLIQHSSKALSELLYTLPSVEKLLVPDSRKEEPDDAPEGADPA